MGSCLGSSARAQPARTDDEDFIRFGVSNGQILESNFHLNSGVHLIHLLLPHHFNPNMDNEIPHLIPMPEGAPISELHELLLQLMLSGFLTNGNIMFRNDPVTERGMTAGAIDALKNITIDPSTDLDELGNF